MISQNKRNIHWKSNRKMHERGKFWLSNLAAIVNHDLWRWQNVGEFLRSLGWGGWGEGSSWVAKSIWNCFKLSPSLKHFTLHMSQNLTINQIINIFKLTRIFNRTKYSKLKKKKYLILKQTLLKICFDSWPYRFIMISSKS